MTDAPTTPAAEVLVTAAAGYIGRSIVAPLEAAGYRVRASARSTVKLRRIVSANTDAVAADAFDPAAVRSSLEGIRTAFYLVHTLGGGNDYAQRDRDAAAIFAGAARDAGVRRIVFFGGLGGEAGDLSEHLSSRHEVGRVLASTGIPVVEFRASIVIGHGSTSFEMIRNLVEKLPAMTTPRWVRMPCQPIAIDDVVRYLVAAVALPDDASTPHRIYEVGGSDIVTYSDLLKMFGAHRGLKRLIIPVPVLSPGLSGWWLYLFTPKQATVGRQLAESLRHPTVVTNDAARRDFPDILPIGVAEAYDRAFTAEETAFAAIRWNEELPVLPPGSAANFECEGRYVDSRTLLVACPPEAAFDPIACIGGENGWYAFDTLWDIRGWFDILLGGPGHRRGRRDQYALIEGDVLEWWRVEKVDSPTLLRLHAEMVMPGDGWLQYELVGGEDGTLVRQTATFHAKGLLGRLYWYAVLPFHHFVFNGTLTGIERECTELVNGPNTCPLPGAHDRGVAERSKQRR
ncbi:MAG: SDR family oxidoreductase [Coriobacteriia bacterium]|nr:SDR family oxidoreductase [Coriobacteriia bacterium]